MRAFRSTNRKLQNSHGDVKYSIGNRGAKESIPMTRECEQWWEDCQREWRVLGCMEQRVKNWDNCNIIITKYNLKKNNKKIKCYPVFNLVFEKKHVCK